MAPLAQILAKEPHHDTQFSASFHLERFSIMTFFLTLQSWRETPSFIVHQAHSGTICFFFASFSRYCSVTCRFIVGIRSPSTLIKPSSAVQVAQSVRQLATSDFERRKKGSSITLPITLFNQKKQEKPFTNLIVLTLNFNRWHQKRRSF